MRTLPQLEQPKKISNRRTIFAGLFGDLFMPQSVLRLQTFEGRRDLNRIQVFALDIFDERELEQFIALDDPDQCGNFFDPAIPAARQRRSPAMMR